MTAKILNLESGEWYSFDADEQGYEEKIKNALGDERRRASGLSYMEAAKAIAKIKEHANGYVCWWEADEMQILKAVMDAKQVNAVDEAKESICKEFLDRYSEWFEDRAKLTDREYANKYGYSKSERLMGLKDNLTAVSFFQKYIFCGRWLPNWEKAGYAASAIWALNREGFLSHDHYFNSRAIASRQTDFLYVSQATAKQIYKEHKAK